MTILNFIKRIQKIFEKLPCHQVHEPRTRNVDRRHTDDGNDGTPTMVLIDWRWQKMNSKGIVQKDKYVIKWRKGADDGDELTTTRG